MSMTETGWTISGGRGRQALLTLAAAVTGLASGPVSALAKDWALAGSVSATTDYVFRGVSQTAEKPAGQATIDFTYKMFYAGMFLSNIDFTGSTAVTGVAVAEIDYYAGVKFPVGKFEFDLGGIYYNYPGANDDFAVTGFKELDYFEFKGGAKFKPHESFTLGAFAYYSPDSTNGTGEVWTFEGSAEYVFHKVGIITPSISGLVGYQVGHDARYAAVIANGQDNYTYWNAGIALGVGDRLSFDFRYWDTNINNSAAGFSSNFCNGISLQCDERFVATAKVTF